LAYIAYVARSVYPVLYGQNSPQGFWGTKGERWEEWGILSGKSSSQGEGDYASLGQDCNQESGSQPASTALFSSSVDGTAQKPSVEGTTKRKIKAQLDRYHVPFCIPDRFGAQVEVGKRESFRPTGLGLSYVKGSSLERAVRHIST